MASDPALERRARIADAIVGLLRDAHLVPPDRLPVLVSTAAAQLGASASRIWLIDHQQRVLTPLVAGPDLGDGEAATVEGTVAGRAFANDAPVEIAEPDGVTRVWLPLVDGVDRIGVFEIRIASVTPELLDAFVDLASVTAAEVIARGQYTDALTVARRRQPMALAAELQWQALPPTSFATRDVTVAGMLEPAYRIGGDTFDYAYNDGGLHVGLFDAVGHGLDSSLLSTLALGAYRNRRRSGAGLAEIDDGIDEALTGWRRTDDYVTGQIAHLDTTTGALRWLNAGHPLPLLIRQGRVLGALSCPPRPPFGLGYLDPGPLRIAEDQLEPGDAVMLYTDGIVEARRPGGPDFGIERLVDFMERAFASGLSAAETVRRLSHAVLDFHHGSLQDDATTVLVWWHPER